MWIQFLLGICDMSQLSNLSPNISLLDSIMQEVS